MSWQSLSAALDELERTDPAVAEAVRQLDRVKAEILAGGSYRQRARRAIAARRWTRAEVGSEAYDDLTDTIDPGDDDR